MQAGRVTSRWWGMALAAVVLLLATAPRARAANGPGVARISLVAGQVSVLRQGQGQWSKALLNTPLVQGDEVYVAGGGRAEIEFDYADTIRLASGADVKIGQFDNGRLRLELKGGTASYTAIGDHFLQSAIDTPNMSVHLIRAGTVRIDVVDASHTSATVWSGTAEITTPQGSVDVATGQQIQVAGSTNPQFRVVRAPAEDAWDEWVNQREQRVLQAADYNRHYLSQQVDGGAELDTYGHWVWVAGYGRCWQPWAITAGWSPYYYGQWEWTPFYGWSWVSYEPWGWAPYHYGRWFFQVGFGWCWWPGSYWGPQIWAPAYVSFFYGDSEWCQHYGFGYGGAIGWVPLGPHERYYGYSQVNYITRVRNVTNIYNINHVRVVNGVRTVNGMRITRLGNLRRLRNAHAPGGVIAVSQRGFGRGRVNKMGRKLGYGALRGVSVVRGTAPVAPARMGIGGRGVAAPRAVRNVHVFSRRPLPAVRARTASLASVDRAMIAARTRAGIGAGPRGVLAQGRMVGRASASAARGRAAANSRTMAGGARQSRIAAAAAANRARIAGNQAQGANRSFRIFGSARGSGSARGGAPAARSGRALASNGGWHAFGGGQGNAAVFRRGGFSGRAAAGGSGGANTRFENHPMGGGNAAAGGAARGGFGARNSGSRPSRSFGSFQNHPAVRGRSGGFGRGSGGFQNHPMGSAPRRSSGGGGRVGHRGPSHFGGGFENHPMASLPRSRGGYGGGRSGGYNGGYRAPAYRAPSYRAPAPSYRAPAYRAPAYRAPAYHAPAYHAPAYRAPAYRAPSYHAPAFHAPSFHMSAPHVARGGIGRRH
jgi:hypothetical protein